MRGSGDVKKYHFIRALLIIAQREIDRVADVGQATGLGLAKLHASGDLAIMNIQARYDTAGEHIN